MAVGLGRETTALVSTVLVLVILGVLLRLEQPYAKKADADTSTHPVTPPASRRPDSQSTGT